MLFEGLLSIIAPREDENKQQHVATDASSEGAGFEAVAEGAGPLLVDYPKWEEVYEPPHEPRGSVIFVDDLLFNLGWFVRLVRKWLPDVAAYGTTEQFDPVKLYALKKYDVIIADVILPKLRATAWLEPYRDFLLENNIAIVFTSALPEDDFWTVAAMDGWDPSELCYYIEKPWSRERFVEIIRECLERSHRHNAPSESDPRRGGPAGSP